MPDDVWPVSVDHPGPGTLYSFNGIGFGLKGFTRVDGTGYRFATRWFMIVGLPVIPLGRYYLREAGSQPGTASEITTGYEIGGTAALRLGEILRTYGFCWLTPIAAVWPLIAVLERADDFPFWVSLAAVLVWPMTALSLVSVALAYYRKHWAPLREVRWREQS